MDNFVVYKHNINKVERIYVYIFYKVIKIITIATWVRGTDKTINIG